MRAGWALLAGLLASATAPARAEVAVQTPAAALAQDAREYAGRFGIALSEALGRLAALEASVAATDALAVRHAGRLAGIAVEHAPSLRIVVLLTGDAPVPDEVAAGGIPITYRTGAFATRTQLVEAIRRHQAAIRAALPRPPALAADPRTGELVVLVNGADAGLPLPDHRAEWQALTGVPVRVETMGTAVTDLVAGGARLEGVDPANGRRYACTAGFVVTDGTRTGLVTAAHCPDTLVHRGAERIETSLPFAGQWGWGYQDVQLHISDTALPPHFFADTGKTATRAVASWRQRDSTRAGEFVCHRGERTGYSCATVEFVDFAPAGDLCGGACLPTWVAVAGPSCRGGDSGAPVFTGSTAFGIVKGGTYRADGSCAFYFYMSVDDLPAGWRLLHRPGG